MTKNDSHNPEHYPLHSLYELQYSDMDWQGHINNVVYLRLMETARAYQLLGPEPLGDESTVFAVVRIEADYFKELLWPGTVEVYTRVGRIGNSSFVVEHIILDELEECAFHGHAIMVTMDVHTRKAVPLTDAMRARLQAWQAPETPS